MQTLHFKKGDAFSICIENAGGVWFEISGKGKIALTPGRFFDQRAAQNEIKRLRSMGYRLQKLAADS